jgi:hypothetical protein
MLLDKLAMNNKQQLKLHGIQYASIKQHLDSMEDTRKGEVFPVLT